MTGYKRGLATLILLMFSVYLAETKAVKNKGRGSDIDNPNVPSVSKLENILESQVVFSSGKAKKPKHLHRFDKPWQKEDNNDVHHSDSSEEKSDSSKEQKPKLQEHWKKEVNKRINNADSDFDKRTFAANANIWPHKTVPYLIDTTTFGDLNKFLTTLDEAIAMFSAESCIKWRVWNESLIGELGHDKYMTFLSASGCSASLGFVRGKITLSEGGCTSVKIFVHEMLHALGMNHEHVRSDRDQYMRIHWQNINGNYRNAFQLVNSDNDDTLDSYSVLQYGLMAFNANGLKTIRFKDEQYEFLTSLSRAFSFYDMKELNLKYQCHDVCQNPPQCQNFGYVGQACTCRCPTGLTGTHCETPVGNCGNTINLVSGEVREITSPGWPNSYAVDLNCGWLIHAPADHRIKVTITDMDLAWNEVEQRCYHWLEMHTNLIGEPGLIRCGHLPSLSTAEYFHSVNSEAGLLLLNFDSTFANDKNATKGFRLQVEAFKSGCISNPCQMGSTCIEGNNDFTFTCECVPGYSGEFCNEVEADATVTCDMEWGFGDHCFLIAESYGWKADDFHTQNDLTSYASQGTMFARPTSTTSQLISGVTFKDGNRCLAFDYLNNGGTNTGGIYVYYQSNNIASRDILHTTTDEGTEWKTIHYNISTTDGFELVFQGIKKYGRITGIDNVIVAPGHCGEACQFVNPCMNGGICVPSSDKLDFTCQCTNGYSGTLCDTPSTATVFACDFEPDMQCFLTQETASTEWTVRGGETPSSYTGPGSAKSGEFYSYINAQAAQSNDIAIYKNAFMNLPATERCLIFYYHMRGTGMGTLSVQMSDVSGLKTTLWSMSGDHPAEWFKAYVDLPGSQDLNIYIQGTVGSTAKSDIGIDDVLLRPGICGCVSSPCQNGGSCMDASDSLSYSCTCTTGFGGDNCEQITTDVTKTCDFELIEEDCFLKQDSTDDFEWTRHQGTTGTANTGPSSAKIGQYYYYMEASSNNFKKARLHTTDSFAAMDRCLKFYYHMYGVKMGSLEVKTNTKSLFLRSGDQQNQWYHAVVPVAAESNLQLIFEGTVGPGWKSDISIDNVILEPRACGCDSNPCKYGGTCESNGNTYHCNCPTGFSGPECDIVGNVELKCTLEDNDGVCFLIQDQTEKQNWIKHSGTTSTGYTGPRTAFGTGTYYYYMEASGIATGDVAMLRTTGTFEDMERCLEFNYLMYGADLGTLKVKVNGAEVFTISGHHPQQWYTEKIDMPIPLTTMTIEGIRGTGIKSDIAVDDIILHPQSCDATKKRQLLLQDLELLEKLH